MTRNTTNRVEVACPVLDRKLKDRVSDMFNILLSDNVKARIQQSDGNYTRAVRNPDEPAVNAQEYFYELAYRRTEEKKERQERLKQNKTKTAVKKK